MSGCNNCPLVGELPSVASNVCPLNYKEVNRVYVLKGGGNVLWDLAAPANNVGGMTGLPSLSSAWTTLVGLSNDAKVVPIPLFGSEPRMTAGAEITNIGLNNVENHVGFEPSKFTAMFEGLQPESEEDINELRCYGNTLEVYFIMYDKRIVGEIDDHTTPVIWKGFSIASALILLGRSLNGVNENDKNEFKFQIDKEWSEKAFAITPESTFNPLQAFS